MSSATAANFLAPLCYATIFLPTKIRNVVIIGSGLQRATHTYTAPDNLKPLVVSGHELGGGSLTTLVELFRDFRKITGPELIET